MNSDHPTWGGSSAIFGTRMHATTRTYVLNKSRLYDQLINGIWVTYHVEPL